MKATCLCRAVEYNLLAKPISFVFCHCNMCRKFHGSAFGPYLRYDKKDFKIKKGRKIEKTFPSSKWASRVFCSRCGSSLRYIYNEEPNVIYLAAGILDGEPGLKPQKHIFVKDKCKWYKINDGMKQINKF